MGIDEMTCLLSVVEEQPSVWIGRTNRVAALYSTLLIVKCADNNAVHVALCIVCYLSIVACAVEGALKSLSISTNAERTYNYRVSLEPPAADYAHILAANGNIVRWHLIALLITLLLVTRLLLITLLLITRLLQRSDNRSLLSCLILWLLALCLCLCLGLSLFVSLTISAFF